MIKIKRELIPLAVALAVLTFVFFAKAIVLLIKKHSNPAQYQSLYGDHPYAPEHLTHDWILRGTDLRGTLYCKDHSLQFRSGIENTSSIFNAMYERLKTCEESKRFN